jgi:hypothetical protein
MLPSRDSGCKITTLFLDGKEDWGEMSDERLKVNG